ncbi:MAG TPA: hypothetical protein VGW38_26685 [Chloroflexota bacterium]|nr:hypothetical protein [Chloroflexota bacterium]
MITLDDAERRHIAPGMDVYDVETHKLGSVLHIHERAAPLGGPGGAETGSAGGGGATDAELVQEDLIEVRTGFLGLGKHLFIPRRAVKDVTEGGVFLSVTRNEVHQRGWDRRPADLDAQAPTDQVHVRESPQGSGVGRSQAAPATWEEALPLYRVRCQQRYGLEAQWERYEARYRFTWDMTQVADLAGRQWSEVQVPLQQRWEVLHPEIEWETVRETIRDAWERVPVSPVRPP